jgi:hypothetical protein
MWQYQVVEYDARTGTCRTNKTGHAASILTFTQAALASSSELRGPSSWCSGGRRLQFSVQGGVVMAIAERRIRSGQSCWRHRRPVRTTWPMCHFPSVAWSCTTPSTWSAVLPSAQPRVGACSRHARVSEHTACTPSSRLDTAC